MGKERDGRGKRQGFGYRAVSRRAAGTERTVTERCGYREVPLGGCGKELGADGGGMGWGQQVLSSTLRATLGCQVTLEISPSPLPLSVQTVKASMKGPKGSPLSDT